MTLIRLTISDKPLTHSASRIYDTIDVLGALNEFINTMSLGGVDEGNYTIEIECDPVLSKEDLRSVIS